MNSPDGENLYIEVPIGTTVKDNEGQIIIDLNDPSKDYLFLKGGIGGRGNVHFASSRHQTPKFAQPGREGELAEITLELKLIADLGLVGFPNVGKSTFIACVTNAHPKIANYHFTTLNPNLGIYNLDIENSLIIADIPGIIEGASDGAGLGLEFLRHIERTSYLFFILDSLSEHPLEDFKKLQHELESYSDELPKKSYFIGISKIDLIDEEKIEEIIDSFPEEYRDKIIPFSSITKMGIDKIRKVCYTVASQSKMEK